jgi:hypothetical protein
VASPFTRPWGLTKPILGCQPNPQAVADLGLAFAALANECGGLATFDLLYGLVGSFVGGTSWIGGDSNTVLGFDGSTGQVSVPNAHSIVNLSQGPCSFLVRFKMNAAPSGNGAVLIGKNDANAVDIGWVIGISGTTNGGPGTVNNALMFVQEYSSHNFTAYNAATFTDVKNYHVLAITFTGAAASSPAITMMLDGMPQTISNTSAPTGTSGSDSGYPLAIGGNSDGTAFASTYFGTGVGGAAYWPGNVDYVLLANQVWTYDQALRLYQEPFHWMQPLRGPQRVGAPVAATNPFVGYEDGVNTLMEHFW